MQYSTTTDTQSTTTIISGTITFEDHPLFRELIDSIDKEKRSSCVLRISQVTYVDSAALGMLLLLRDQLTKRGVLITLSGASGNVAKILTLSNFGQLFTLQD